ncbi:hypothetical protein XACJJ10_1470001 [Xanthomonas citri pv. citri]|nr:hypothetical protein XAC2911_670003 [Xanthomonas citri pv. citri]CEE68056.1 hypothetical protein XAC71A_840003 [Xanthomonas citri pv. citri]CEH61723.1 hypothetical protein XACG102_7410002 [Xanthomonas citri pv. citri]CEI35171.1 hypothetical protein XACJJ10_1470001 [Xanthomonas citri pv. citri]
MSSITRIRTGTSFVKLSLALAPRNFVLTHRGLTAPLGSRHALFRTHLRPSRALAPTNQPAIFACLGQNSGDELLIVANRRQLLWLQCPDIWLRLERCLDPIKRSAHLSALILTDLGVLLAVGEIGTDLRCLRLERLVQIERDRQGMTTHQARGEQQSRNTPSFCHATPPCAQPI